MGEAGQYERIDHPEGSTHAGHASGHACGFCSGDLAARPMGRRAFAKGLLASASAAALAACATNPVTGRSNFGSIEDDVSTGQQEHPNVLKAFGGAYDERGLGSYVTDIGRRLAAHSEFPNLPYRFTILNTPIVNALALPGGYIYVTRGLMALASSEAELAGVMGHELGHVTARHSAERQTQSIIAQLGLLVLGVGTGSSELVNLASVGAQAYLQSYSRDQEFEADLLGVRYMAESGWDPDAMASFLASLREWAQLEAQMAGRDPSSVDQLNMMASHPRTIDRVQAATQAAGIADTGDLVENRDVYLRAVDGIRYGDDPSQGVIDGRWFRHPGLRFEFEVPNGFRIINGEQQVSAVNTQGAAIVFDIASSSTADMAQYLSFEWAEGTSLNDLERISVNGLNGATGWTRMQSQSGQVDVRAVALRGEGNRVYRFLFLSPAGNSSFNTGFQRTTYSFRLLSSAEAAQIKGFRLYVITEQGESVSGLSRTLPYGTFNESAFRILNDLVGGGGLARGELVKVVRAS